MNQKRKNEKGFTMVELIIVVAIMGVIGALLVPAYGKMTTKARITTDISTVKTLSRTAASYKAEQGGKNAAEAGTDKLKEVNKNLMEMGYLDQEAAFQSDKAKLEIEKDSKTGNLKYKLDVSACDESIKDTLGEMVLSNKDLEGWAKGYTKKASE